MYTTKITLGNGAYDYLSLGISLLMTTYGSPISPLIRSLYPFRTVIDQINTLDILYDLKAVYRNSGKKKQQERLAQASISSIYYGLTG
jgi:hypothetical protein